MYYALSDPAFWGYGLLSLVAFFFSCYIPGWLALSKLSFKSELTKLLVSCALGTVLWAAQGYIFGYTNIRWATYVYLVAGLITAALLRKRLFTSLFLSWQEMTQTSKLVLFSIPVAVAVQLFPHIGSGFIGSKGLGINFVNAADGMMHLAYIRSLTKSIPPLEPGQAGIAITNYHYWSDLVFAEFARVWHLPIIHLFFQYVPILLIALTTLFVIQIIKSFKGGIVAQLVALFLFSFGADAAFIFALYFTDTWGHSIAALDTGVSFIFNMPQVFSRFVFLGCLVLLVQWTKAKENNLLLPLTVLAGSLFVFKVYYGLFFLLGFGFYSLYAWITSVKKNLKSDKNFFNSLTTSFKNILPIIFLWIGLAIMIIVFFLPNNQSTGGLVYIPLAWPRAFLSADNFNYQEWMLRMQVYEEARNYRNIFIYNSWAICITLISVYGVRLLGLFPTKAIRKKVTDSILWFAIPSTIIFTAIGLSFYQEVGGLNIYNFLITPIVVLNIFLALNIDSIKSSLYKSLLIILLISLSAPRSFLQLKHYYERYYSQRPDTVISFAELELLEKLRMMPEGTVQADSWNEYNKLTPYVSFFTDKYSYFAGENLLRTSTAITEKRKTASVSLFNSQNPEEIVKHMEEQNIDYLFITNESMISQIDQTVQARSPLQIAFQNQAGLILTKNSSY